MIVALKHKVRVGPQKEKFKRNSTNNASWGSGPQQREFHKEILQTKQAGVTN